MSHLIDRLRHHASNKEYTAFARSTMTEAAMTIEQLEAQRDRLVKALEEITGVAERVDGWESFPRKPLDAAYATLAAAKGE